MPWQALYVNSRSEKKIAETLRAKRIEAYVPLIKTMRQWSDRKKMVEVPLLNGYVFVSNETNQNEVILQTKGVVSFVKSEGKIANIRNIEIERLKQLVELGYQLEAEAINRLYKPGDLIKITSGPLKGIEGYVSNPNQHNRIEVVLGSIGQCIKVKLPPDLLLPRE
jgi:transcription antitermination factor NusG